jgi:hypothetical protein
MHQKQVWAAVSAVQQLVRRGHLRDAGRYLGSSSKCACTPQVQLCERLRRDAGVRQQWRVQGYELT